MAKEKTAAATAPAKENTAAAATAPAKENTAAAATAPASKNNAAAASEAASSNVRTNKTIIEGNPIVKIDKKEYEVRVPLFSVPGFGTFTNKEAATNDKLLRALLEMGSSVLKEVF